MSSLSKHRGVHRKMKKRRTIIITVICLVVVGIVLSVVLTRGGGSEDTLSTFNVTRGDIVKSVIVDGNSA
jgi:hypothetical protein